MEYRIIGFLVENFFRLELGAFLSDFSQFGAVYSDEISDDLQYAGVNRRDIVRVFSPASRGQTHNGNKKEQNGIRKKDIPNPVVFRLGVSAAGCRLGNEWTRGSLSDGEKKKKKSNNYNIFTLAREAAADE